MREGSESSTGGPEGKDKVRDSGERESMAGG